MPPPALVYATLPARAWNPFTSTTASGCPLLYAIRAQGRRQAAHAHQHRERTRTPHQRQARASPSSRTQGSADATIAVRGRGVGLALWQQWQSGNVLQFD